MTRATFARRGAAALVLLLAACDDGATGIGPRDIPRRTVAAGTDHACALDGDGLAYCWGSNRMGQLGTTTVELRSWTPVAVASGRRYTSIAAATPNQILGPFATCALTGDGETYCWGRNSDGVISATSETTCSGVYGDTHYSYPCVRIPTRIALAPPFAQVTVGGGFICGVTGTGEAWCWGRGDRGQLGNGAATTIATPVRVVGGERFAMVSAGDLHACGLASDGTAWCWGDDSKGQLGQGTTGTWSDEPVRVDWPRPFRTLDAGDVHTCAVDDEAHAVCWGDPSAGRLGTTFGGAPTIPQFPYGPVVASAGQSDFVAVSAGVANACALDRQGTAWCWGVLATGENGTYAPSPIGGGGTYTAVTTGLAHGCLRASAGVRCWGDNEFPGPGQLGVGEQVPFSDVPLPVTF